MSDPTPSGLSLKDTLVALPLFGSALAMCWEVGSFVPIGRGSFMMFSLTEHLLFAVQALPIALAAISWIAMSSSVIRAKLRARWLTRPQHPQAKRFRNLLRAGAVGFLLLAAALGAVAIWSSSMAAIVLATFSLFFAVVVSLSARVLIAPPSQFILAFVCFALLFSMAMGFDNTRAIIRAPIDRLTDISIDGSIRKAIILRVGDKGILVFDPSRNSFSYLKMDGIKSLDWIRPSFR